ncbi:type III-A CRISPR-associated RAMP protein Csm3 [Oscillatoria salina]|uniref:type III-A CRISPR-associated RAMP protein Csm3 n=1 Tax=Oscillatoria salina TaxID=331517 RepID=UPI001CD00845|nr:type III-A CRISPR-associated RAMP protein Csm3 [Oscillatoria salina]MBZ8182640.1 type III-A CRISPR-associated RAMP protein Csm3 [Oscillatoria salina IIICB1]
MSEVIDRPQKELLGKLVITSNLLVKTGLHIGGGGENLDIGGLDKPVIRDPITQQPYLPGSSLKGKLRAILERWLKKPLNRPGGSGTYRYESDDLENGYTKISGDKFIYFEGAKTCPLSRVFGSTGGTDCWIKSSVASAQDLETKEKKIINEEEYTLIKGRNHPARLIVRDCHLSESSVEKLKKIDTGLYMTEWKFENSIDRVTAAANPRQLERVPAGTEFNFEMVYTVENKDQAVEDLQNLAIALAILEDDALGGHGSRGYGKVSFENFKIEYRDIEHYRRMTLGETSSALVSSIENTAELLSRFGEVRALLPETKSS